MKSPIGILLLNLGTPEAPTAEKVKPYLKEFLMDPLVVDIPFFFRWFLVNQIILRTRPKKSAEAYKKVWTDRGSPLLFHTLDLAKEVQKYLGEDYVVVPAMRYGRPSIKSAIEHLKSKNVTRILALPLYPQYSLAATQSSMDECVRVMKVLNMPQKIDFAPAFYERSDFIKSYSELIKNIVDEKRPEKIVFSFHGVPERHVKKTDLTGAHCLESETCCDKITEANKNCYRAQSFATARAMAKELGLTKDKYEVSFQSRLGRTPWIKPHSDVLYKELAAKGVKKIAVVCPSFVADCLETLEEVAIRGKEDFIKAGGQDLFYIPSLNSNSSWVKSVASMVTEKV